VLTLDEGAVVDAELVELPVQERVPAVLRAAQPVVGRVAEAGGIQGHAGIRSNGNTIYIESAYRTRQRDQHMRPYASG